MLPGRSPCASPHGWFQGKMPNTSVSLRLLPTQTAVYVGSAAWIYYAAWFSSPFDGTGCLTPSAMSLWGRKSASFPAIEIRPRSALPPAALVRDTDTASALPGSSTSLPIPSSAAGNNPVPSTGPAPPSIATAKPRRYKCSLCSSAFARAEHLARHERSR